MRSYNLKPYDCSVCERRYKSFRRAKYCCAVDVYCSQCGLAFKWSKRPLLNYLLHHIDEKQFCAVCKELVHAI